MERLRPWQLLLRGILVFAFVILAGVIGYWLIEGWSFLDSLFMTVITLTTVGYGEVHPLSTAGRIFSIILILVGVGSALYILSTLVPYTLEIIETEFGIRFGRRRMEAKIKELSNHFIVCGYGRVGQEIANTFKREEAKFVVIDQDEKVISKAKLTGYLFIQDDATKDEVLKQAGIERARCLVVALGNDADNTYVTLSARALHPTLPIIARADSENTKGKLLRAGANHVISPQTIGGRRMAMLALRPVAVDFVETVLFSRGQQLLLEEMQIKENSLLARVTVKDIEERSPGIRIMAVKRKDGSLLLNPTPTTTTEEQDLLTVFGTADQLHALENCCQ